MLRSAARRIAQMRRRPSDLTPALRIVATHHKTGTRLMQSVCHDLRSEFGLRLHDGPQEKLDPKADLWFEPHGRIDWSLLSRPAVGVHVVRHPYSLVISAYRYHLRCSERWCIDSSQPVEATGKRYEFDGRSYQEKLRSLEEEEGILFEMRHRSYDAILAMYELCRSDVPLLTIHFEEIMRSFDATFRTIFERILLSPPLDPEDLLDTARKHDINRWSQDQVASSDHVTNKERSPSLHADRFSGRILDSAREVFPDDLLAVLGYE